MDTYRTAVGMKSSLFLQRCSMEMQADPPHVPLSSPA